MSTPVIETFELEKQFRRRSSLFKRGQMIQAVKRANIKVMHGESLGLVGESGSGKTTLARMIVGLEKPTSGRIQYHGHDIEEFTGKRRRLWYRKVQFVFQDPLSALNPKKTIRQILLTPLRQLRHYSAKAREQRIDELMHLVNLRPEFLKRYPHEVSGGQIQRIGIMRALAANPELLILDEPTSALDGSVQAQILNLLRDLKEKLDLTYIVISHDLAVVDYLCDHVAVMQSGAIVEQATSQAVFTWPQHPFTKLLVSSLPKPLDQT